MSPNMVAIDEAMAAVEAEYAKGQAGGVCLWKQDTWVEQYDCGTGGCLFGWRAILDGAVPADDHSSAIRLPDGTVHDPEVYGQSRFGLDWGSVEALSAGSNSIEDLRRYVAILRARGRIRHWSEAAPEPEAAP